MPIRPALPHYLQDTGTMTKLNRAPGRYVGTYGMLTLMLALWVSFAAAFPASAQLLPEDSGGSGDKPLLEKHAALSAALANNAFGRPLVIESIEGNGRITGHAYAVIDAPFATASAAFQSPDRLCDLIILHLNTKYCRPAAQQGAAVLNVNFGKKTPQELGDTFALAFTMNVQTASPELLSVLLDAKDGPLGTSNYRIAIDAVPLPGAKTFLHLRYSYGYGVAGKIAMSGYLATAGSKKVGFTKVGKGTNAGYIGGMRGAVERNTMRYYLAIDSYLANVNKPPAEQQTARLNHWFDATEKYPEQLGEIEKDNDLSMKKAEYLRQQSDARR